MKTINKLGFTLIELLVVITIIGVLATGATAVYTSQIQKARDVTRINDIKALEWAVEQAYWDESEYPSWKDFQKRIEIYMRRIPGDAKHGKNCSSNTTGSGSYCAYAYKAGNDDNSIELWAYELSTAFENKGNVKSKAEKDDWSDADRLEVWVDLTIITSIKSELVNNIKKWICTTEGGNPSSNEGLIVINWKWTWSWSCGT